MCFANPYRMLRLEILGSCFDSALVSLCSSLVRVSGRFCISVAIIGIQIARMTI